MFSVLFSVQIIRAQTSSEYRVKAVFIFNFTHFVDWPASSFTSSDSPFIIGIIGKDPFGNYLEEAVANEKVGSHPIVVHHFSDLSEVTNCQILYINYIEPVLVKSILNTTSEKNILTVNDALNFPRWGGIIGFFTENDKIRLQVNVSAAKKAQLAISSKLLHVARIVESTGDKK